MIDPRTWLGLCIRLGILIGFLIATSVFEVLKWVQGGFQVQVSLAREELGTKSRRISDLEAAQSSGKIIILVTLPFASTFGDINA